MNYLTIRVASHTNQIRLQTWIPGLEENSPGYEGPGRVCFDSSSTADDLLKKKKENIRLPRTEP